MSEQTEASLVSLPINGQTVRVAKAETVPTRPGAETDLTDRGAIKDPLL